MSSRPRIIVWAEPILAPLVQRTVEFAHVELVAAGAPTASDTAILVETLGVERADDLRAAAIRDDIDLLWLAVPGQLGADERRVIRQGRVQAISSVPRPGRLADLAGDPDEATTARVVPLFRRSPGWRNAEDVLAEIGEVRSIEVTARCRPDQGSVSARLFDAVDLVHTLAGEVQSVDASLSGPLTSVPETVAALHGHLAASLRPTGNCVATISVSDLGCAWFRGATVVGTRGCLRVTDEGLSWIDAEGRVVESNEASDAADPAALLAEQIRRVLDGQAAADLPPDLTRLLAWSEAITLSCRSGQSESPYDLLAMWS